GQGDGQPPQPRPGAAPGPPCLPGDDRATGRAAPRPACPSSRPEGEEPPAAPAALPSPEPFAARPGRARGTCGPAPDGPRAGRAGRWPPEPGPRPRPGVYPS